MRDKLINRMCDAQPCCHKCPVGMAAQRLQLDCRQYIGFFPEAALTLAQAWEDKK